MTMNKEYPARLGVGLTALSFELPTEAPVATGCYTLGDLIVENHIVRISLVPGGHHRFGSPRPKGTRMLNLSNGELAAVKAATKGETWGLSPAKASVAGDGSRIDICFDANMAKPLLPRTRRPKTPQAPEEAAAGLLAMAPLPALVRELNRRVKETEGYELAIDTTTMEVVLRAEWR